MTEETAVDPNAQQEQQRLFPDAPTDEPVWTVAHTVMGQTISFDVWRTLIKTEMVDQCDIKSNHRKAILRKTEKTLQRGVKMGLGKLNEAQMEQMRWNAFIILVDKALGNNHLKVRADDSLCDGLIDEAEGFKAA
ncbi:MAG: hypothetical protein ACPG40_00835 [Alphaproteobacteria bacterium]